MFGSKSRADRVEGKYQKYMRKSAKRMRRNLKVKNRAAARSFGIL